MRLNGLMVPSHKFRGQDSTLSCLYDMEGEQLYSVKWYKDDHEFFRFIPADRDQKITIFRLPGVKVDVSTMVIRNTVSVSHRVRIFGQLCNIAFIAANAV